MRKKCFSLCYTLLGSLSRPSTTLLRIGRTFGDFNFFLVDFFCVIFLLVDLFCVNFLLVDLFGVNFLFVDFFLFDFLSVNFFIVDFLRVNFFLVDFFNFSFRMDVQLYPHQQRNVEIHSNRCGPYTHLFFRIKNGFNCSCFSAPCFFVHCIVKTTKSACNWVFDCNGIGAYNLSFYFEWR